MNIGLVQTRMTSSRLPGKAVIKMLDKTIIEWVMLGLENSFELDYYGIIMPDEDESKKISKLFSDKLIFKYFGSKNDLIDRYLKATLEIQKIKNEKISNIVRITGDCPLIAFFGEMIDELLDKHIKERNDFTHNRSEKGLMSGIDVEIMTFEMLKLINEKAYEKEDREHVTKYILRNSNQFKIGKLITNLGNYNYKWSVDDEESFKRVEDIMKLLSFATCNISEVIKNV